jgi:hypothetical protein
MAVVAQAVGEEGRSYGYVQGYAVGEIFLCAVYLVPTLERGNEKRK